jgi:hypothetical protein
VQDADDATEQIEREIGIVIECEPTGDEEKRKFTDKTQDELIELLIRAQVRKDRCLLPSSPALFSISKVADKAYRLRWAARFHLRHHHHLLLLLGGRKPRSKRNRLPLPRCLHLRRTSTSSTSYPKAARLAWVFPAEAEAAMLLKHRHSNSSSQSSKAEAVIGKCRRQDLLVAGALLLVSSRCSRVLLNGRLEWRAGTRIKVVETRTGRTTSMQRIKARLQTEAGVKIRLQGAGVQQAEVKRLLRAQVAGDC